MSRTMKTDILILAAGAASRMRGADKLLEDVGGEPLLARVARAALATGQDVTVVLPPDRPLRAVALEGLRLRRVIAQRAAEGMAESVKAGLAATDPQNGVMLLLADLPEITAADLAAMLALWQAEPAAILRGTAADGTPGHPVCFPPDLREELAGLQGDEGARSVIVRHRARLLPVPLPDRHAVTDLDTPEEWAEWRAGRA